MAGDELFVVHDPEGAAAAPPQPQRTFVGARGDDVLMPVAVHVHDAHRARPDELERDGVERQIAEPAPVPEHFRRAVQPAEHHVQPAIAVEVGDGDDRDVGSRIELAGTQAGQPGKKSVKNTAL